MVANNQQLVKMKLQSCNAMEKVKCLKTGTFSPLISLQNYKK